jgi:hypothetical protein
MRMTSTIPALVLLASLAPVARAQLFATGSASGGQNRYFSINVQTGVATALSTLPTPTQAFTTTGLAFDPSGTAFGISAGQLVRPNFVDNTLANVGPLGINPQGQAISAASLEILADGRAFTYETVEFAPLYQINLTTGAATGIGGNFDMLNAIVAAGGNLSIVDQPIITGMGSLGGTLYGIENKTGTLVSIDPGTGAVTVPGGAAGQLRSGTLLNGNLRNRYTVFAALTGYDSNSDGQYDRLFATVNNFDGNRLGALIELNPTNGSWELIGNGNAPLNFFALGSPITSTPACPADLDNDGVFPGGTPDGGVDINDLIYFLTAFEAGSVAVDLDSDGDPAAGNPDGGVDVNDLLYFLARFEVGC